MDLFGTAGIRGPVDSTVRPELALAVGRAAGIDVSHTIIGRDGRLTGPAIESALTAGLHSVGSNVTHCGVVPTPVLAHASIGKLGIMITASHNPPTDNGIKIFKDGREIDEDQEKVIAQRVSDGIQQAEWKSWSSSESIDAITDYRKSVLSYLAAQQTDLSELTIALGCGNGTAGLIAPTLFSDFGADISAINANVDGTFPARPSKPTQESLESFSKYVSQGDFSIGFAYDGDADRIVVLSSRGQVIHEDTIVAILAEYYVRQSEIPDPVVVTTPNASARIDERVTAAGSRVERCPLGALHEGIEQYETAPNSGESVVFAAEPWKHIHPKFGGWIDGILSGLVIAQLTVEAGGLGALRSPINEPPNRKINVGCPDELKQRVMNQLELRISDQFAKDSVRSDNGIRVDRSDGSWFLIRPSGTEPFIRIYIESPGEIEDLSDSISGTVEEIVTEIESPN